MKTNWRKEKDEQIAKDSLDVLASSVPGLNIAWALSKALYGAGLRLRHQRALEWVEMIRDNPDIFTKQLLEQEDFQDGFVIGLEKYITERNEEKRKHYRKIFLGFAKSNRKKEFELEKYWHALSQLNDYDIEVLQRVDTKTPNSYQLFDDARGLESIHNLTNAGIIFIDHSPRYGPIESPYVYTSDFGRRFVKYLRYEN